MSHFCVGLVATCNPKFEMLRLFSFVKIDTEPLFLERQTPCKDVFTNMRRFHVIIMKIILNKVDMKSYLLAELPHWKTFEYPKV